VSRSGGREFSDRIRDDYRKGYALADETGITINRQKKMSSKEKGGKGGL
jgi:hypothetical protein